MSISNTKGSKNISPKNLKKTKLPKSNLTKRFMTLNLLKRLKNKNADDTDTTQLGYSVIAKFKYVIMALIKKKILIVLGIVVAVFMLLNVITSSLQSLVTPYTQILIEEDVMMSYKDLFDTLQQDFENRIENLQTGYDDIQINNFDGESYNSNFKDIICIMSVEFKQDLDFNLNEQRRFNELYNMMNSFTTDIETFYKTEKYEEEVEVEYTEIYIDEQGNEIPITKTKIEIVEKTRRIEQKRLVINKRNLGLENVVNRIKFSEEEKEWVRFLYTNDLSEHYPDLNFPSDNICPIEMRERIKNARQGNMTRRELVDIARSLVGKVPYFWGGKSTAGFNPNWGRLTKVTSAGSRTTGTTRPFGLDCSGYVDWIYKTAGFGNILADGTTQQWNNSYPIQSQDLKIGDLVFLQPPSSAGVNHIGIYAGISSAGERLYLHSASRTGVTLNNYKGFKYYRRAYVKFKGD